MLIDGFYPVIKGALKLTIDNPETGERFEKVFGPGEHFGERVLVRSALRTGLVVALEDSVVLWVSQQDFTRLARAFPFLDTYFKDYIEKTFGGPDKAFAPGSAEGHPELMISATVPPATFPARRRSKAGQRTGNKKPEIRQRHPDDSS